MDVGRTEKKLREAQFFLEKLRDQESRAFGDREPFDFYLSAFLGAARSVDYHLRQEQWAIYPRWREAWDSRLQDSERGLIKFLVEDRNVEVREIGSTRSETTTAIPIDDSHTDPSSNVFAACPPSHLVTGGPYYWIRIDGSAREATEACTQYLELLKQMVEAFKSVHGASDR